MAGIGRDGVNNPEDEWKPSLTDQALGIPDSKGSDAKAVESVSGAPEVLTNIPLQGDLSGMNTSNVVMCDVTFPQTEGTQINLSTIDWDHASTRIIFSEKRLSLSMLQTQFQIPLAHLASLFTFNRDYATLQKVFAPNVTTLDCFGFDFSQCDHDFANALSAFKLSDTRITLPLNNALIGPKLLAQLLPHRTNGRGIRLTYQEYTAIGVTLEGLGADIFLPGKIILQNCTLAITSSIMPHLKSWASQCIIQRCERLTITTKHRVLGLNLNMILDGVPLSGPFTFKDLTIHFDDLENFRKKHFPTQRLSFFQWDNVKIILSSDVQFSSIVDLATNENIKTIYYSPSRTAFQKLLDTPASDNDAICNKITGTLVSFEFTSLPRQYFPNIFLSNCTTMATPQIFQSCMLRFNILHYSELTVCNVSEDQWPALIASIPNSVRFDLTIKNSTGRGLVNIPLSVLGHKVANLRFIECDFSGIVNSRESIDNRILKVIENTIGLENPACLLSSPQLTPTIEACIVQLNLKGQTYSRSILKQCIQQLPIYRSAEDFLLRMFNWYVAHTTQRNAIGLPKHPKAKHTQEISVLTSQPHAKRWFFLTSIYQAYNLTVKQRTPALNQDSADKYMFTLYRFYHAYVKTPQLPSLMLGADAKGSDTSEITASFSAPAAGAAAGAESVPTTQRNTATTSGQRNGNSHAFLDAPPAPATREPTPFR